MSGTAGLLESEEMYRTIFDAMSEGVVMQLADGSVGAANSSAERILGCSFKRPGGGLDWPDPLLATIAEDGSVVGEEAYPATRALATGKSVHAAVLGIFRRDGSLAWISVNAEPIFHPGQSKPYGVVTTFVDITARKQAESQLRTLLDTIPDLVWLKDPEGVYLACNKEFEIFFGAPEAQIVGKTDHDFVAKELADFFRQKDREAMAAGRPSVNEEWVNYASDGRRVLLETIKTPMRDASGELIGVLGIARDITKARLVQEELRQTAERLRDSEQRWQRALQGADHGVWDWDMVNQRAYYSPWLRVMLGIEEMDYNNTADPERWRQWLHPEDLDAVHEAIAAHIRGDAEQLNFRNRMRHADGHYIWVQTRGRITARDAQGRPTRMSGTNTDITQAVAAERALLDSQLMYKGLVEAMPMAFFRLDLDGRILFANQFMFRTFGLEREEDLVGQISYDLVPPEEGEMGRRDVAEVIETGKIVTRVREIFVGGLDESRHLEITRIPLFDAEGKVVGVQGVFRDITEQIRATEQQRLAALVFESSQLSIAITDATPRILAVNPTYARINRTSIEEARGKVPGYTQKVRGDGLVRNRIWDTARSTGHWEGEVRNPDKHEVYFVTVDALRNAAGEVTNFVIQAVDITARVRAEEQLRELNEALEQKVQERTRDLEATVRELEAFSYSISHDLRAPLRSIEGFTRILEQKHADRLDESGKGYLNRVCKSSQRMAELIDDLLALSQVTRGEFQVSDVDLTELAQDVAADLAAQDTGRKVEIRIDPDLRVRGDQRLLKIAMENLIGNAWKFTAKADRASISVSRVETPHGVAVSVHDNGAGFDMRYVDKLFKPFQRLHSSMEFPGTGIGLAIVQRVISRHGGRVWAESAIGFGATIYFVI